ncbi:ArnT family glycosyltransferase [Tenacibaculum sp. M341]|uniref:ArnT family glycosyltransferase n=1 Tax=Tenacibaculum sp. M341 TaxID=2530339 RepID=UPI00104EC722|nr:glycosyltransferase family 39 protein [Tenacibaculum sp. M341]TCI85122.1 glycosyltransferase family 39 protein [Tenacibaculum sp. M341]
MKAILQSKYFLPIFLVFLAVINLIQGYTTELIADEAYYWTYSNELDWGYFDHPPMVALWITISKFFIASGELSVRFFAAFTLSLSFYLIWLTIKHPKKEDYKWLFVLLILATSLFNAYGFITVPDTPLMLFASLFFLGYRKYLDNKSFLSYILLTVSMAAMLYSKYQAILIIFFVLISNLKVLRDGKIWLTALGVIFLFSPHLLWQINNDFPSFKYHLFERKEHTIYYPRDTYMHFVNMIAIIGFTFPIVYKSLLKNLKTKDPFQKGLNFVVFGFIIFFFISTFKGHAQAQWIVPISIPLIIIPFNYLLNAQKGIKTFKILAFITIAVTTFLRFAMANDGILPHQFEMHGNKKWVSELKSKVKDQNPLFINSYQNTSLYWFYTGQRPYQINAWYSRKNQYDLYNFNKTYHTDSILLVNTGRLKSTDSLIKKNNRKLFIKSINGAYERHTSSFITIPDFVTITKDAKNRIPISFNQTTDSFIDNPNLKIEVVLKSDKLKKSYPATLKNNVIRFIVPKLEEDFIPTQIQIVGTTNNLVQSTRLSKTSTVINK